MACRPYNTGRCLLLRLFNPSKLWGSLQYTSLRSMKGFSEVDDVMHNTIGCILGYILVKGAWFMVNASLNK